MLFSTHQYGAYRLSTVRWGKAAPVGIFNWENWWVGEESGVSIPRFEPLVINLSRCLISKVRETRPIMKEKNEWTCWCDFYVNLFKLQSISQKSREKSFTIFRWRVNSQTQGMAPRLWNTFNSSRPSWVTWMPWGYCQPRMCAILSLELGEGHYCPVLTRTIL